MLIFWKMKPGHINTSTWNCYRASSYLNNLSQKFGSNRNIRFGVLGTDDSMKEKPNHEVLQFTPVQKKKKKKIRFLEVTVILKALFVPLSKEMLEICPSHKATHLFSHIFIVPNCIWSVNFAEANIPVQMALLFEENDHKVEIYWRGITTTQCCSTLCLCGAQQLERAAEEHLFHLYPLVAHEATPLSNKMEIDAKHLEHLDTKPT